jgi:hypothetical protein
MKPYEQAYRELSTALAASSKRGLPMIITGCLFWLTAGLAGFLDHAITVWVYLYGIGLIFPVGILIARLMNIDLFAKDNPLAVLAGVVGAMQILFAPLVILILFRLPEFIPFAVGVLTGAHFLPYAIIYRSKAYLFLSIATVAGASLIGVLARDHTFLATPFALTAVYLVTCLRLMRETAKQSNGA